jgi:hypothetical protein
MKIQKNLNDYKDFFRKGENGDIEVHKSILEKRQELGHKNFWKLIDFTDGRMSFGEIEKLEIGMVDVQIMRIQFNKNSRKIFQRIAERDGEFCRKCGAINNLTVDHIIPLSKGGSNDDDNFQILCTSCNRKKGAR